MKALAWMKSYDNLSKKRFQSFVVKVWHTHSSAKYCCTLCMLFQLEFSNSFVYILGLAGRSPVPESQLSTPTSMEVLEVGGAVTEQEEDVVLSWGQGGRGSADDPLVISSNDHLEGEDSEIIAAFSG